MKYVLILCCVLIARTELVASSYDSVKGNFFRDIDLFNLKGIGKLSLGELNRFPYYRVTEIDDNHRLVELISEKGSYAQLYEKEDTYWVNTVYNREEVEHNYIFTYVLNDRIIQLYYMYVLSDRELATGSFNFRYRYGKKFKLFRASIRTEFEYSEYSLDYRKSAKWIEPSPRIGDILPKFSWRGIYKNTYSKVNDHVLKKKSSIANADGKYEWCYDLIDKWGYKHNIFWEYSFFLAPMDCE